MMNSCVKFVKCLFVAKLSIMIFAPITMAQTDSNATQLKPNLTMNLVLNSAGLDEQNEHYAEFVESLMRQFPRDVLIDPKTAAKLKEIDPAFDYMNVVAYLPRFGKDGEQDPNVLMPDKKINLLKVAIKTGQVEGKDVSALEEVLLREKELEVKTPKPVNNQTSTTTPIKTQTFVSFDHKAGTLSLFDTEETRDYLMRLKKGSVPAYILDMVHGKSLGSKIKATQTVKAAIEKSKAPAPKDKPSDDKLYFDSDAVELTVAQRQKLIKWVEKVTKIGVKENFGIMVATLKNPFVDDLGERRLKSVRGFLRQLDVDIDAGYQALSYVNAESVDKQYIEFKFVE